MLTVHLRAYHSRGTDRRAGYGVRGNVGSEACLNAMAPSTSMTRRSDASVMAWHVRHTDSTRAILDSSNPDPWDPWAAKRGKWTKKWMDAVKKSRRSIIGREFP